MSTVVVLAPIIIANWPMISAAVGAAVGTMGFAMVRKEEAATQRAATKTREEIAALGYDGKLVSRVLGMVGRAEFKRRQAAPVLKVSPRAFGTGRRIPIARTIHEA